MYSADGGLREPTMTHQKRKLVSPILVMLVIFLLVRCGAQNPTEPQPSEPDGTAISENASSGNASSSVRVSVAISDSDRAALTALYKSTNGPRWTRNEKWLTYAPLGEWHGVTTDDEGRVIGLDLPDNNLAGAFPLAILDLANLRKLNLAFNTDLVGQLPRIILRSSYTSLVLEGTDLCIPADTEMLAWLGNIRNHSITRCNKLESQSLVALAWFYNATSGQQWRDNSNWLSDRPLHAWHGITVDTLGRITEVNLSDNSLSGPLPGAIGNLEALKHLDLSKNPGLVGQLPASLFQLSLESLNLSGTELCVPSNPEFQAWVTGVSSIDGARICDDAHPDWEALAAFYATTSGPDWANNTNWFSKNPLNRWYGIHTNDAGRVTELNLKLNNLDGFLPPEIGQLDQLRVLRLSYNNMGGRIPPELGSLVHLEVLDLFHNLFMVGEIPEELGQLTNLTDLLISFNNLSGPIPPVLGNLIKLKKLSLHVNQLSGRIPPELGRLKDLEQLSLSGNQLSGKIPPELGQLKSLSIFAAPNNGLTGEIPPELVQLPKLEEIHLDDNRLEGEIPPEIVQAKALKWLTLGYNRLTGSLPTAMGQVTRLEHLDLSNNRLSGEIPPELGRLTALTKLILTNNPDIHGVLPPSLANLRNLDTLLLGNTQLCAPHTPKIQTWLSQINGKHVAQCPTAIKATAFLTQAIQSFRFPVPLVAGEDALLRVVLTNDGPADIKMPPVHATFYQGDLAVHKSYIPGQDVAIPGEFDAGLQLNYTANAFIPGQVIMPGLEVVVDVEPEQTTPGSEFGIATRIPETGRISFDVEEPPIFTLSLVPFLWTEGPDMSNLIEIQGLTPQSDLFRPTRDLLPVSDFILTVHSPVWTSTDPVSANYLSMTSELEAIHAIEGKRGYTMGIFRRGGSSSVTGVAADIPSQLSFSILNANTIAHELGHNMNLRHAPCGGAPGSDPAFPQADGSIGTAGFDFRNLEIVQTDAWDIMSYCSPAWISDYHFNQALNHRMIEAQTFRYADGPVAAGLLIWGSRDASGELILEPAFMVEAAPVLPRENGPYTIEAHRGDGSVLFTMSFPISEFADAEGGSFAFILPVHDDWAGSLDRITLVGPAATSEINADGDRHYALMQDPITGEVRGILRDWFDPTGGTAGRRIPPEPGMEITVSSGIPGPDSW